MLLKIRKYIIEFIQNVPTILTIVFGAYVVLKNQENPYNIQELLGWIITLIALLATSMLIERVVRLKNIERKVIETNEFLKQKEGLPSLDSIIINRKQLPPLEERFDSAKEIKITGGSLFRLATEYIGFFEDKAREGCKFKFLLLNPNCEAAKLIAKYIVYEVENSDAYISHIKTALSNLKALKNKFPNCFEIKICDFIPSYSIMITDDSKEDSIISVELYTQSVPTRERPQLVLNRNREPHWFGFFMKQFEEMWKNGTEI